MMSLDVVTRAAVRSVSAANQTQALLRRLGEIAETPDGAASARELIEGRSAMGQAKRAVAIEALHGIVEPQHLGGLLDAVGQDPETGVDQGINPLIDAALRRVLPRVLANDLAGLTPIRLN